MAVSVQPLFMMSHFSLFTAVMSFFHEPLVSDSHLLVLVRLWSTGSRIFPGCLVRQWSCSCVSIRWLLGDFAFSTMDSPGEAAGAWRRFPSRRRDRRHAGVGYELVLDAVLPQMV